MATGDASGCVVLFARGDNSSVHYSPVAQKQAHSDGYDSVRGIPMRAQITHL